MSEKMFTLPVVRQLHPCVSLRSLDGIPVVVVEHPRARAAVSLQGAQLLLWQPDGAEPVLWLGDAAPWTPGKAIRGGVPICWPWFGGAGSPAHGFARTSTWQLDAHEEGPEGVSLALTLRDSARTRELWPHAFTLTTRIGIGRECSVDVEAHGDHDSTAALHTYLRVGDLDGVQLSGLGGEFVDKLRDDARFPSDGTLVPTGHFDRIYAEPSGISRVVDHRFERAVEVRHRHHSDVVVWNPGPELSHSMADLGDESYREFVCVETARVSRPMATAPDAPSHLAMRLRVDGLHAAAPIPS
ncbi:D-hexose-6-phosphate mutarotase [Streptomyces sp. SID3343]|uniref:D-hexose-6-phosphate mutarotase n=1 Tax=Streptomyces sp. SID3343 TaxID=2690260 RepID=UPI00136D3808|nr:D-hexose-6-phosphate mutarotase [Streptomyces sp. SID3343]MYW02841.1 D-hexose-6-phosphate mutarotase [Streptomyces sp. SID3343]